MGIFQQTIKFFAPPWFLNTNMGTLLESVGQTLDIHAQRVFDGRRAGNPYAAGSMTDDGILRECDPDVLSYHSRDRQIRLYTTEPILSQRIRLSQWRQLHKQRGIPWGIIDHVRPYFADRVAAGYAYPTITIVSQDNMGTPGALWYSVAPDGTRSLRYVSPSNLNLDGTPAKRTRWVAFVNMTGTGYTAPATWGGFSWSDGTLWGVGGARPLSTAAQADIVSMFLDWQSASSWCSAIILVWPGSTAFPSYSGTPTQDADGRWSLPNGANTWTVLVDPATGKATRPSNFQWLRDSPG